MPEGKQKKPKQRHRLLVNPQELGLTARIKKALIEQDMGITQRIKRAVSKTQDENSFFYMKQNHFIMVGVLLFLMIVFGFLAFKTRHQDLKLVYPDGRSVAAKLDIPWYHFSSKLDIPAYKRQIKFKRVDIYGDDLGDSNFAITTKDNKAVKDPRSLYPGVYALTVRKEGYKLKEKSLQIGDVKVEIPIELEPLVIPKRELVLNINDPLLDSDLAPDDIRLLKNDKSIKDVKIKPGKYAVRIIKAGYHPKEMELYIPENGIINEKITLDYKKRGVQFFVNDGLSEKGHEPKIKTTELFLVQEGKKIGFTGALKPGYYDLEVNRDGYKVYKERIKIKADATLLKLKLPLEPLAREIVVVPNYDIAPQEFKPDKAYLKDMYGSAHEVIPITDGLKIQPGRYWIKIEKANYHPYSKEIVVNPASKPYEVKAHLISVSKLVLLKIRSDFDVEPSINPDHMMIDMKVSKEGYRQVDWGKVKRPLPPEKKEIEVPVFLETIPRRVITEITSDLSATPVRADIAVLTRIKDGRMVGQSIDINKGEVTVKPGRYLLHIKKTGFEEIKEQAIVYPGLSPFVIRKELKAERRPLIIEVDTDYEVGKFVRLDEIKLNREPAESGMKLKPGSYNLFLRKDGFHVMTKTINITPGSDPYVVKEQLRAKARKLIFAIVGEGFTQFEPDLVTFDGNEVTEKNDIPPKKNYEVMIKKKGYEVWKKTISVEPSEDPFKMVATLKTLKRRILLEVEASFPAGFNLLPLDKAALSGEIISKDTAVKPGKYELVIVKSGYKAIKEELNIQPDEVPMKIKRILDPKDRDVQLQYKYDVQPENMKVIHVVRVKSEDGSIEKELTEGSTVVPNKYKLTIDVPGYQRIEKMTTIPASESTYLLEYELDALPRTVVFDVTADYPPDKEIEPDKVLLNGKPIGADVKLSTKTKPGRYSLVIDKGGYHSIKKEVFIPAGTSNFVIKEQMTSAPRVVRYKITNAESNVTLIPDKITLGTQPITGDKPFKPGKYNLYIRIQGYPDLTEALEIPPGVGPYEIKRAILPSSRLVQYEIKGDYNIEKLEPKEITLNGKPLEKGSSFAPGQYNLVVYVPGYSRLIKRINIGPSRDIFVIRESLVAKKRKVFFNIRAHGAKGKLKADRITFAGKDIVEGEELKPKLGGYAVIVNKKGYMPFEKTVVIEPSEKAYTLDVTLASRPRHIKFELDSDYKPGVIIDADEITVGGKKYGSGFTAVPGEHEVLIKKAGYKDEVFKQMVDPGTGPLVIKKRLSALPRLVTVKVKSDFSSEVFEPEVCTFGDRDVNEKFKPGEYELNISHIGYMTRRERIKVEPGKETLALERILVAKKRKVVPKISFDRKPMPDSQPHVIRLLSMRDNSRVRVQEGDALKPGEYRVNIEKEGYETIHSRVVITPDERPFELMYTMSAKMIQVLIEITYDIAPPKKLAPYTVTFIDVKTGIGRNVSHGKRIKPGHYMLQVARPGYAFRTPKKKIHVPPGTKPFWVKEKLYAKPRQLSFEMTFKTILVRAKEVVIDGKRVKAQDRFNPGQKYKMTAKFKNYKTASKDVLISPGEAPYVVDMKLEPLHKYEFRVGRRFFDSGKGTVIDGLRYPLELYVDGEQVESHQIERSGGVGVIYGNFFAPRRARAIRIVCAFYFDQSNIKRNLSFRDLGKIDAGKLLDHLRELAKGRTPAQALKRVARLLRDRQDKFKITALPREDREGIINLLRNLDLTTQAEQDLRNKAIKKLR